MISVNHIIKGCSELTIFCGSKSGQVWMGDKIIGSFKMSGEIYTIDRTNHTVIRNNNTRLYK